MTSLKEWTGTTLVTLGYNAAGNRSTAAYANGAAASYGYDPIGRLTGLTLDFAGTAQDVTYAYDYNPASQLVSRTIGNDLYAFTKSATSTGYGVNGLNQYTQVGAGAVVHDPNGNLTQEGGRTLGYDSENKLATVAAGAGSPFTLLYDPQGRMRGFTTTLAVGIDMVGTDIVTLRFGSAPPVERYAFAPGVDEPMVGYDNVGTRYYFHADGHGNVVARSNAAGSAIQTIGYDEYGRPSSFASRFLHAGKMHFGTVNAYYNNARWYDYNLGRFLQTDPVGYKDQMNLYAYVANDPVNKADPTGLYICKGKGCDEVEAYVKSVNASLKVLNSSSSEYQRLQRVSTTLGAPGERNGITIKTRELTGNRLAEAGRKGVIKIDIGKIETRAASTIAPMNPERTFLQSARDYGATILGHEVDHQVTHSDLGMPKSEAAEYQNELQAYRTSAAIANGLNLSTELWSPSLTQSQVDSNVAAAASASTKSWCDNGGPC